MAALPKTIRNEFGKPEAVRHMSLVGLRYERARHAEEPEDALTLAAIAAIDAELDRRSKYREKAKARLEAAGVWIMVLPPRDHGSPPKFRAFQTIKVGEEEKDEGLGLKLGKATTLEDAWAIVIHHKDRDPEELPPV